MTPNDFHSAEGYRTGIAKLSLNQQTAAEFFQVNERTSRRWATTGPPYNVAIAIFLLLKFEIDPTDPTEFVT